VAFASALSCDQLDSSYDLIEDRPIATFTEIGHTFNDVFHPEIHRSNHRRDAEAQRRQKANALEFRSSENENVDPCPNRKPTLIQILTGRFHEKLSASQRLCGGFCFCAQLRW
jgi:hypothetical protein